MFVFVGSLSGCSHATPTSTWGFPTTHGYTRAPHKHSGGKQHLFPTRMMWISYKAQGGTLGIGTCISEEKSVLTTHIATKAAATRSQLTDHRYNGSLSRQHHHRHFPPNWGRSDQQWPGRNTSDGMGKPADPMLRLGSLLTNIRTTGMLSAVTCLKVSCTRHQIRY